MTGERFPDILAEKIERKSGLPCGLCGGHHVETGEEWERCEHPCFCRCCHGALGEAIEAEHPDLVTTVGGVRVITEAAFAEALRRLEAEVAALGASA